MKNRYVLFAEVPLIAVAAVGAFAARFDWRSTRRGRSSSPYLAAALVIKPITFLLIGMYCRYWRYASVQELFLIILGVTVASIGMAVFVTLATVLGFAPGGFSASSSSRTGC